VDDFSMAAMDKHIGQELGVSDWVAIDQSRVDMFASCTPAIINGSTSMSNAPSVRARSIGPIAHGYLTLSMARPSVDGIGVIPQDAAAGLNYGLEMVRFLAPVARRRASASASRSLLGVEPKEGGQVVMKDQNHAGGRGFGQARH